MVPPRAGVIELRVLGSLDLRDAHGHELRSVLAQPKRMALLTYLAVASPSGFHRRDKLLPLFWPEADQEHARASLRKALHILRQALGEGAIVSRGDEEIGLNADEVWCDAAAFVQAVEAGSAEQALDLYQGDLLDGVHLSDAGDFEQWLETERGRLRRKAQLSARTLAMQKEQERSYREAAHWYRKSLGFYPDDETDIQALVRLLDRTGDRAGALHEYARFARRLREDLDIEPSPESQALIAGVRSRASASETDRVASEIEASGAPGAWKAGPKAAYGGRAGATGLMAVLVLLLGLMATDDQPPARVDEARVVAVLPFRVSGADPFLAFLRDGMVDLLASKLSGTDHLRTIDPRTLLTWWRRAGGEGNRDLDRVEALDLARQLGAGRLLEGEVTGTARHLTLSAVLTNIVDGTELRATVEAPYDSLSGSIDRLAAQLLALEAGEPQHRLATLTSTSLPAVREYLEGMAMLRRAAYPDAVRHFDGALELDSTFALAGLGRTDAAIWVGEGGLGTGSIRAWPYRDRLSGRDRARLRAMVGPNYPYRSTNREWFAAAEDVARVSPDDPQAWATVGDQLFHFGGLLGMPAALERSRRAYDRAIALDSSYLPGWEHVAWLAALAGDSSQARQIIHLRLRHDSISPFAREDHWLGLRVLGDTALPDLPLGHDSIVSQPNGIAWKAVSIGAGLADADTVLELTVGRVQGKTDRRRAETRARNFYLIRGWPARARLMADAVLSSPDARKDGLILDAIYADGDSALANVVARGARQQFSRPRSDSEFSAVLLQILAAQLELKRGNPEPARRAVRAWLVKPMMPESLVSVLTTDYAARLFDTQLAALDRRPDALARLEELDTLLMSAPTGGDFFERIGNIESARLWHQRGNPGRALKSIRRRLEGLQTYSELPRYLRDEGRYAALAGDREGAVRAYRRYLVLRSDAEPWLQPRVDSVRAELASLENESVRQ